jgi:hypothetical protein
MLARSSRTMLKLCLGIELLVGHRASAVCPRTIMWLFVLPSRLLEGGSDIRQVSLHAEGGNPEQNRLLQVYPSSAMGSYVES